jgi:hypothetical protein
VSRNIFDRTAPPEEVPEEELGTLDEQIEAARERLAILERRKINELRKGR